MRRLNLPPMAVAAAALIVGLVLAALHLGETGFVSSIVATYLGAVLGFFVALYVDRLQRANAAQAERRKDADAAEAEREKDARAAEAQRERDAQELERRADELAAEARTRRVAVLRALREELAPVPDKMVGRQEPRYPPAASDRLSDGLWRAFSASGELRWIVDLDLLQTLATAYEFLAAFADVEERWRQSTTNWGIAGQAESERGFREQLRSLHNDTWRNVSDACDGMDQALVADGAAPGSNHGKFQRPT